MLYYAVDRRHRVGAAGRVKDAYGPSLPDAEVTRIVRAMYRHFGVMMAEFVRIPTLSAANLDRFIDWNGVDREVEGILAEGKGVIMVTGHIGNWELGSFHFGLNGVRTNVVTIREGRPEIDAIRESHRVDHKVRTLLMDDGPLVVIEMMAALKRREVVAMLVDRWGEGDGIPVEFFGRVRKFPRGPFALSRATGATILTAFVVRDGRGYKVVVEPPFVASGDEAGHARTVADALERVIRRHPDQWYNFTPVV
jgi:KDO2-lipid IV(A) lauroyltransferase